MKKLTLTLATVAFAVTMAMATTSAAMSAELPVEDYPGGIEDDPTDAPTLSDGTAGRELPVEEFPGGTGGGNGSDEPTWSVGSDGLRDIIQNFFSTNGR